jgi:hypothetical protein
MNIHSVAFVSVCREVVASQYSLAALGSPDAGGQVTINKFPFLKNSWVEYWKWKLAGCHHKSKAS